MLFNYKKGESHLTLIFFISKETIYWHTYYWKIIGNN